MSTAAHIKFISNKETQLFNLIGIGFRIPNKFFAENSYYVLPYLLPENPRAIYFPLLKNDIDQQLLAESEKYQQNFGINPQNIFTIKENTILTFNTPIMFTQQEKDVMIKLIEKSPMIASLDDIANAM